MYSIATNDVREPLRTVEYRHLGLLPRRHGHSPTGVVTGDKRPRFADRATL